MESLLLFRRALASPTMCRFIPALSGPEKPYALVLFKGSRTVRYAKALQVGRTPSAKSWGISASP